MDYTELHNSKFVSHMHLSNGGARTDSAIIYCPRHILDGKVVYRHVWTPKNQSNGKWGKGKAHWTIEGADVEYDTLDELLSANNLPPFKKLDT